MQSLGFTATSNISRTSLHDEGVHGYREQVVEVAALIQVDARGFHEQENVEIIEVCQKVSINFMVFQ
jgi:hypothetical protein